MRVHVSVKDESFYLIDINLIYLGYNRSTLKYSMTAGGYDICGGRLPSPMLIEDDGNIQKATYANFEEALQFLEWVRDALARAEDSFSTMMD